MSNTVYLAYKQPDDIVEREFEAEYGQDVTFKVSESTINT